MSRALIEKNLEEAQKSLSLFMSDARNIQSIQESAELMITALKKGNKIISCGNGGSMCDAMHFAEELSGRFRDDRPALAAVSISDPSHITCAGNDYGFSKIFSRYIEANGRKGDVLLAISTSGNSENIIEAARSARSAGISVVALTGKDGGALGQLADKEIRAPQSTYADRAQEIHIKVIHSLIHCIEEALK